MLNVQSALNSAGVPGYRSAYRAGYDGEQPPDCYCVHLRTLTPEWGSDDKERHTRIRAFLHLYARSDPTQAQGRIARAMEQEGFRLIRVNEDSDHDADLYEILSEWEGHQVGPAY